MAADRDGYIAKHPTYKYTIDGQPEVELVVGANDDAQLIYGTQRAPKRVDRIEIAVIPCTSGFSWEYIVEDNEGSITTESGRIDAPFDGGGGSAEEFCADDYPQESCTILNDQADITASFFSGQSCASAAPGATVLTDFGCSGFGVFTACGACVLDSNIVVRGELPDLDFIDAFSRALDKP